MRRSIAVAALAGTALVLAGCGEEDDPVVPDAETIESELELRTITLPDGRIIECLAVAHDGYHFSWTELDCNWDFSVPPLNG